MRKISCLLVTLSMLLSFFLSSNVYAVTNSESLYNALQKKAILDNQPSEYVKGKNGIDLTEPSSVTNGMGLYTIASTTNKTYPIHYYRGDIDDNNVVFAGACWKIVRTSETGGIKLIYDHIADYDGNKYSCEHMEKSINNYDDSYDLLHVDEFSDYMYTNREYDTSDVLDYLRDNLLMLKLPYNDILKDIIHIDNVPNNQKIDISYGDSIIVKQDSLELSNSKTITNSNELIKLKGKYVHMGNDDNLSDFLYVVDVISSPSQGIELSYTPITVFYKTNNIDSVSSDDVFITSIYDAYTNKDVMKKIVDEYPYSIGGKIRDLFIDGDNINEFIINSEMDESVFEYQSDNKNPSAAKTNLDEWYEANLTKYSSYLEDTVWYNDRSINILTDARKVFSKVAPLNFSSDVNYVATYNDDPYNDLNMKYLNVKYVNTNAYDRVHNSTPSLAITNKNDAFTVSNKIGNGKLKYPIGLITSDEVMYASGVIRECNMDVAEQVNYSYLSAVNYSLTMSPSERYGYTSEIDWEGFLYSSTCDDEISPYYVRYYGIAPMISLKTTTILDSGTGTERDPYIVSEGYAVKYEYTGDVPENAPNMKTEGHKAEDEVTLPSAPEIKGYRFVGWETEDVTIKDNQFVMPEKDVTIKMRYVKLNGGLVPETLDDISKYIILFVGSLAIIIGIIILRKKMKK